MTTRDQFQLAAELALAGEQIKSAAGALDRFSNLAAIHGIDGRNHVFLALYHLREATALVEKAGTVGSSNLLAPSAQDAPAAITEPAEEISPASEEQTETVIKTSADLRASGVHENQTSGAGDSFTQSSVLSPQHSETQAQ